MTDADRDRAAERLRTAAGEGRITLDEYEQRLAGVLAARTYGDLAPFFTDIPGAELATPAPEFLELKRTASAIRRKGEWLVPRRLKVANRGASVVLNFTGAVIPHPSVEIELDVVAGSTTLVVPPGASVDIDEVQIVACQSRVRGVPHVPGAGPHFTVRGRQVAGDLWVRHEWKFWRWRW